MISSNRHTGTIILPVLLIVILLAILGTVLIAMRGHFVSAPANESDRKKATTILQIGENLKVGMDRLFQENKASFDTVDTNVANTSGSNRLFSPTGGGITPPSWSMASQPSADGMAAHGDIWHFLPGAVPGLGTSAPEMLAILKVSRGVCGEINNKTIGLSTPAANDLGDFYATANDTASLTAWPHALNGRTVGCVYNNNSNSNGYFFFEILAVQ